MKPKFIDLATLTGAIIVCLGSEYWTISNDKLSFNLQYGRKVEEKYGECLYINYDKLMNSKNECSKYKLC